MTAPVPPTPGSPPGSLDESKKIELKVNVIVAVTTALLVAFAGLAGVAVSGVVTLNTTKAQIASAHEETVRTERRTAYALFYSQFDEQAIRLDRLLDDAQAASMTSAQALASLDTLSQEVSGFTPPSVADVVLLGTKQASDQALSITFDRAAAIKATREYLSIPVSDAAAREAQYKIATAATSKLTIYLLESLQTSREELD